MRTGGENKSVVRYKKKVYIKKSSAPETEPGKRNRTDETSKVLDALFRDCVFIWPSADRVRYWRTVRGTLFPGRGEYARADDVTHRNCRYAGSDVSDAHNASRARNRTNTERLSTGGQRGALVNCTESVDPQMRAAWHGRRRVIFARRMKRSPGRTGVATETWTTDGWRQCVARKRRAWSWTGAAKRVGRFGHGRTCLTRKLAWRRRRGRNELDTRAGYVYGYRVFRVSRPSVDGTRDRWWEGPEPYVHSCTGHDPMRGRGRFTRIPVVTYCRRRSHVRKRTSDNDKQISREG